MNIKNILAPDKKKLSNLLFERAEIYFELKDYNKCIDDLENVITINGFVNFNAYLLLSISLRNTGNYMKSKEIIDKAIQLSEQPFPKFYIERGITNFRLGDYTQAVRDFLEGLNFTAFYPEANRMLALTYDKLGDIQGTMKNMIMAAEQGDLIAQQYIKKLGNFMDNEYNALFPDSNLDNQSFNNN